MKQSPEEQQATERMQPGVFSRDGFLGSDRRPIGEIIDTDLSALAGAEVTQERVAARMYQVLKKAMVACGGPVKIGDHLTAVFHEAMGRIPSPFGDGMFPKGEVELGDERTGEKFYFTPLSVHLIAAHAFFQGKGSRYRIDPTTICRLLDVRPSPQKKKE